jgi:hypothetical protein
LLGEGGDDGVMTGVILLLVLAIAVVALIGLVNLILRANADHERDGLFGEDPRARRLEIEALAALASADHEQATRISLAAMVDQLDRLAFDGVPLVGSAPTSEWGWWLLRFGDGTELRVQVGDPRAMTRARNLASREPIVVTRVVPHADSAVVELSSPRHRPVRVALRS